MPALVLVAVITASWLYLFAGAGTGMYPHEMATLVPDPANMEAASPATGGMSGHESTTGADGRTGGMFMSAVTWTPGYALLMFFMWWLMMIAMMLPSAAPMVLLYAAVTRTGLARPDAAGPGAPAPLRLLSATAAFIAGYAVTWGAFSLAAVIAQWGLEREGLLSTTMTSTSRFLGLLLLLAAGFWQLTPLKSACLRHCRSPIGFLSTHWRPGVGGAFRMGVDHGVFCCGCCWFLMTLLFYGGVMNLFWIVGLALFVLVEKTMPAGVAVGRAAGLLLIAWGAWLGYPAL